MAQRKPASSQGSEPGLSTPREGSVSPWQLRPKSLTAKPFSLLSVPIWKDTAVLRIVRLQFADSGLCICSDRWCAVPRWQVLRL